MIVGLGSLHTWAAWATLWGFPLLVVSLLWAPTKWWAVYRYWYVWKIVEHSIERDAHIECCFPRWFRWVVQFDRWKTRVSLWLYRHLSGIEHRPLIEELPFKRGVRSPEEQKLEYRAEYKASRYGAKKATMKRLYRFSAERYIDRENCQLNYFACGCGYTAKADTSEALAQLSDEHWAKAHGISREMREGGR